MSNLEQVDRDRIRLLTLCRESSLNAFDNALYDDLSSALLDANNNPDIAVVLLTGRGRAFSVGQDMAQMAQIGASVQDDNAEEHSDIVSGFPGLIDALQDLEKPLIAAVNGLGVGLGFTILAHCDLVILAEDVRLRAPFCPLGVAPEAASSALFPDQMGWQNAAWSLLSGEWMTAQEALQAGIAWKVVPPEDLGSEALDAAAKIACWPISSLVATKRAMLDARAGRIARARAFEDAAFAQLIGSPANVEAVVAFFEKRAPDFRGIDGA